MALIKCPECGKGVSDTIKTCPHCGYKIKRGHKERNKHNNKRIFIGVVCILLIFTIIGLVKSKFLHYEIAIKEYNDQNYEAAKNTMEKLSGYKDADDITNQCNYNLGKEAFENQEYEKCIELFQNVYGVEDTYIYIDRAKYGLANDMIKDKKFVEAFELLCTVNKDNLTSKDDLNEALKTCVDNDLDDLTIEINKLIKDGKIDTALNYSNKLLGDTRLQERIELQRLVQGISAIQGTWYDPKDMNNTIDFQGLSIVVNHDNDIISKGEYIAEIGECLDPVLENTYPGLIFGDGFNVTLPGKKTPDIMIYDKDNSNYIDFCKKEVADKINRKNNPPSIGMTSEQVEESVWGIPYDINKTTYSWGTKEQWCYSNNRYVYFENGIVTAISE